MVEGTSIYLTRGVLFCRNLEMPKRKFKSASNPSLKITKLETYNKEWSKQCIGGKTKSSNKSQGAVSYLFKTINW